MHGTVSIIMPTYNREKLISRAIESIMKQTYTNWELLIVDDYSTDNTKEKVEQYVNIDKRIKYLKNGRKKGSQEPEILGY
jgi:glycosyltransferase involved in cell wall biosynthesis